MGQIQRTGGTAIAIRAAVREEQKDALARMTPLRRIAEPEDIAGAVLMVASDHCGFMTGTYIPVSGGALMLSGSGPGGGTYPSGSWSLGPARRAAALVRYLNGQIGHGRGASAS